MRLSNTTKNGLGFLNSSVQSVWERGNVVPGYDARTWRLDSCGAWMRRDEYGNTSSDHGWEIDHICPVAAGGGDELTNLQPLHWKNNRGKGDDYPHWSCTVKAKA